MPGQKVVRSSKTRAPVPSKQVMSTLQLAAEQLKRERDAVELDLRANVGNHVGDPGQSNPRRRRHHLGCDEGIATDVDISSDS